MDSYNFFVRHCLDAERIRVAQIILAGERKVLKFLLTGYARDIQFLIFSAVIVVSTDQFLDLRVNLRQLCVI